MSLTNGGPLIVEDLSCTMQVRTFDVPRYATRKEIDRFVKRLVKRYIRYTLTEKPIAGLFKSVRLQVGRNKRSLSYWVIDHD